MPTPTLPGEHAFEYRDDEAGDTCWDCLLGLAREGVRVYRVPDLETDVSRTFRRTELGGLTLEVRLVDGARVGYLRESSVDARRSTVDELVAAVGEVPAELIKQRLVAFLRWPCNARGLHYEWGEVVDVLLDPSRDPSDDAHPDDLFAVTVARTSKGPEWWVSFAAAGEPFAVSEVSREDAIAKARAFMATHGWRDDMGVEVGLLLIRQYERGRDDEAVARGGVRIFDDDDAHARLASSPGPVPMLLACPTCHAPHVDAGEWATRPHRTHLCAACGAMFRPALVPTVGVAALANGQAELLRELTDVGGNTSGVPGADAGREVTS